MHCWKRVLLGLVAAALMLLAVLTWGSLGSAVCIYGLVMLGSGLLVQRFGNHREEDQFDTE